MTQLECLLTETQIQTWRDEGAVMVQLPEKIWKPASNFLHKVYPEKRPQKWKDEFGSPGMRYAFPTATIENGIPIEYRELDDLVLNEELIKIAQVLLKTEDIKLTQADAWCKYGSGHDAEDLMGNKDQRMHMDYGMHSFLHPKSWAEPDIVAGILYYDDSEVCGGGTGFVKRNGKSDEAYEMPYVKMPGQAGIPFWNQKDIAEEKIKAIDPEIYEFRKRLYKREEKVKFKPGTLLLYRHDLWHRGTVVNPEKSRRVHNLIWVRQDAPWVHTWNNGFAMKSYYGPLERLLVRSSPLQRSIIGFPGPKHALWKDLKYIHNVKARYPGMDLSEYGKT